jgi:multidrug efflux pump subunit AcrA (membrane-fusion protein)
VRSGTWYRLGHPKLTVSSHARKFSKRKLNWRLHDAQLISPFDGVVTEVALRRGETSQPGQPFVSVGDLSRYQIETSDLDQSQLGDIVDGQTATVTFDALPGVRLPAHIVRVAPMATTGPGGTNFTLTLDLDQAEPRLRWGMTSTIELQPRGGS